MTRSTCWRLIGRTNFNLRSFVVLLMNTTERMAPEGKIWKCSACGKLAKDRDGLDGFRSPGWDVSCMLHAVLVEETTTVKAHRLMWYLTSVDLRDMFADNVRTNKNLDIAHLFLYSPEEFISLAEDYLHKMYDPT